MNYIKFLFLKVMLFFISKRISVAKNSMLLAINSTKNAANEMNDKYDRFISLAKKQQEISVAIKRIQKQYTQFPILNKKIDTGKVNITSKVSTRFSNYDIKMALTRHKNCDWGCVPFEIWKQNNRNVQYNRGKVLSDYTEFGKCILAVETDLASNTTFLSLKEAV